MTMLELLVGLVIFSFAILPIISFGTSTTRTTYITGKHLMAGQIATGLLDRLLALPFDEAFTEATKLAGDQPHPVLEDPVLAEMVGHQALAEGRQIVESDLQKSFRFFEFRLAVDTDTGKAQPTRQFKITVFVSWRVEEGNEETRTALILQGVKFNDLL
ncbi:MAG: hypothetical protein GX442_11995 [Candidatus Riflebacteria bacterium]|nr:hypothetical protein [Candidatus Riflebacteria bacterium]